MTGMRLTRRDFLLSTGLCAAAATWPGRLALAYAATEKRLLLVILRGGMDGLAAVVPYGDRVYAGARGDMALPQNAESLVVLDHHFAMHKSLAPLAALFQQKELLVLHAAATPYRERSHFEAQDLLENGSLKPHGISTGWLSRAVAVLPGTSAVAVGPAVPLVLRGDAPVTSWAPSILPEVDDDFLNRVMHMYEHDPLLSKAVAGAMQEDGRMQGNTRGPRAFVGMMQKAALFLSAPKGARIGAIDMGGWDTHANQGTADGRLANNMEILAEGLTAFRQGMGAQWENTAVLVVTEFGRTVKSNGTGGTDHGTAGVAFLLGGSVQGGQVVGDWPGLSRLYEGRDLYPANDLRRLLKGTLHGHLGIAEAQLAETVFPGSGSAAPFQSLFRA